MGASNTVNRPRTALRAERTVMGRVPVLRCDHCPEGVSGKRVDGLKNAVPIWYGKCTAGQEIILDIDKDKSGAAEIDHVMI